MKFGIRKTIVAPMMVSALVSTIAAATTPTLQLSGSIEAVDVAARTVTVSGRRVATPDAARVVVGQFVSVYGTPNSDGSIANAMLESYSIYSSLSTPGSATAVGKAIPALTGGGGEREELTGGGGEREELTGGGGEREELTGGGGEREELTGGGGEREELTGGGGEREELTGGGGEREELTGGGGEREELTGGGGEREE